MSDTDMIASYITALARDLRVGPRRKARILAEVKDHLQDAIREEQECGATATAAWENTVARFGPPAIVARQFMADLSILGVRAASRALFAVALAFGLFAEITSPLAGRIFGAEGNGFFAPPGPWPNDVPPRQLQFTVAIASGMLAIAVGAALFALVHTHLWRRGIAVVFPEVQIRISRRGTEGAALAATVLGAVALAVGTIANIIWSFQRAAEVPHSPTPGVLAGVGLVHLLALAAGAAYVIRAVRWAGAAAGGADSATV
jgi:hypothetical protein